MIFHRTFILLFFLYLNILPLLSALQLGLGFNIDANFFARFFYLACFLLFSIFVFFSKKKIAPLPLVFCFVVVGAYGSIKGLAEGFGGYAFYSHIYYVVMPTLSITYGWYFYKYLRNSSTLRRLWYLNFLISFQFGVLLVILFLLGGYFGVAKYDALGLWNFQFAGPFLLYQRGGIYYFAVSFVFSFLAGKRGVIVVFVVFLIVYLLVMRNRRHAAFAVVLFSTFFLVLYFSGLAEASLARWVRVVTALSEGDFDFATARRWTEALAAIDNLNERFDHWLVGAGFGATFRPWPHLEGYQDYYSHYTHFSFISFVWLGGVIFAIFLYSALIHLAIVLTARMRDNALERDAFHFGFWLWGVIFISVTGADLMNNPFLWFVIGCCLSIRKDLKKNLP